MRTFVPGRHVWVELITCLAAILDTHGCPVSSPRRNGSAAPIMAVAVFTAAAFVVMYVGSFALGGFSLHSLSSLGHHLSCCW